MAFQQKSTQIISETPRHLALRAGKRTRINSQGPTRAPFTLSLIQHHRFILPFFWNLCINQIMQFMIFFWERIGSGLLLVNYLCCMLQQIISYCCIIFHGLAIHRMCYLSKYVYISVGIYVQVQLLSHLCSISVYAASFSMYSPISNV